MSRSRRGPGPPDQPLPRRPSNTDRAIDDVVGSAADEVERRLKAEGISRPQVTPREILRSRYPSDSVDDEAVTEEMRDPSFAPRTSGRGTSSLSPIAIGPRPSRAPAASPSSIPPRPGPDARRAALAGGPAPRARGRTRTFFSRAPSAAWILALITLGGVTAFTAVMASRAPGLLEPASTPRPRAAAARPSTALPDAGATGASATSRPPPPRPSRPRPDGTTTRDPR